MIYFNANTQIRAEDAGGHGVGGSIKTAIGEYKLSSPLTAGQTIPLLALPSGARIVDMVLASDILDNGAGLKLDIGDKAATDRYFPASSLAQSGGIERLNSVAGMAYRYTKSDTVNLSVQTAPSNQATTGNIKLAVLYVID